MKRNFLYFRKNSRDLNQLIFKKDSQIHFTKVIKLYFLSYSKLLNMVSLVKSYFLDQSKKKKKRKERKANDEL